MSVSASHAHLSGRAEDRDLAKSIVPTAVDNGEAIKGFLRSAVSKSVLSIILGPTYFPARLR